MSNQGGYDQFGRPISARAVMPNLADLGGGSPGHPGGQGMPYQPPVPAWVRYPFFPTAPYYSTNPNVGTQIRFYSTGILSSESDVTVGSETLRTVSFDIPVRVIAINGSCVNTLAAGSALAISTDQRDFFLFRVEYSTGDKLHVSARLGSTVVGTMDSPGELGGYGYNVDNGGTLQVFITPIRPIPNDFRIDITFHCLEVRGSSNFVMGGGGSGAR